MDVKGPWSVRDDDQNPHYKSLVLVDDSGGRLVASIPLRLDAIHVDRHAREFARLIAAAPAMFGVLRRMVSGQHGACNCNNVKAIAGEDALCDYCCARAVIVSVTA